MVRCPCPCDESGTQSPQPVSCQHLATTCNGPTEYIATRPAHGSRLPAPAARPHAARHAPPRPLQPAQPSEPGSPVDNGLRAHGVTTAREALEIRPLCRIFPTF